MLRKSSLAAARGTPVFAVVLLVACGGNIEPDAPLAAEAGAIDAPGTSSGDGDGMGPDGGTSEGGGIKGSSCGAGESPCGAVCVDEQTDPNNCGGCGLVCSTPCTQGRCVVTFESSVALGAIAVDPANVYWIDNEQGALMRAPLDGGTAVTSPPSSTPTRRSTRRSRTASPWTRAMPTSRRACS